MASLPPVQLNRSLPIFHSVAATVFEPGHSGYIFVSPPVRSKIKCNSVYLTSTQIAQRWPTVAESMRASMLLSINCYFDILKFFRDEWQGVKLECLNVAEKMRHSTTPQQMSEQVFVCCDCHVHYDRQFGSEASLKFILNSSQPESINYVQIKTHTQSIVLHPDVMSKLSKDLNKLVEDVFKAGHHFCGNC